MTGWKGGKEKVNNLLKWCHENCEGKVTHVKLGNTVNSGSAFAFENEANVILFTLVWR